MTAGVINVLKPPGMTSHDVVSFIRRTYGIKRVGHAGTLDPAATGVLPVFFGQATRMIEYVSDCDKSYRVELTFGYATDTGDDTGRIMESAKPPAIDVTLVQSVLQSFTGEIEQVPPMYSAIKIGGKKLYELARSGATVERKPRKVTISAINLLKTNTNSILFDVNCSKGTYIRSLCIDIGQKIGCPAVMSFLVRTRVGQFLLQDARTLEEIGLQAETACQPVDSALQHLPAIELTVEQVQAFRHGQKIICQKNAAGPIRIYDQNHCLIGIGKQSETAMLIPLKVFPAGN
ncbi:tRNA pseudouridine synthase B [Propionispora sp. 2/2-37]|uniref:tRNA pseudouridine(55) synthase TruB n=1 Tax=Propionispora sp. 2/2-37 TaxID=1677858 RepID=UPI0006BB7B8A|nr:tRNA pseudouridine(55) synthase TruB [Propionispora sp. 2/2-37]CUH96137.1 tRNA pseudouridine synthase B [Propionispora sp. 2/2-37]